MSCALPENEPDICCGILDFCPDVLFAEATGKSIAEMESG
jgi:hypothetical protein